MKRKILAGVLGSALVFTIALQCFAMGPWEPSPREYSQMLKSNIQSIGAQALKDLRTGASIPPGSTCELDLNVTPVTSDFAQVEAHCKGFCRDEVIDTSGTIWRGGKCMPLVVDNTPVACVCSGRLKQ